MARATDPAAERAAQTVARQSYGKLVAFLAARTGDVAGAEDALAEAFASALQSWPGSGIPRVPEAWLLTVARRRMIDAARRRSREARLNLDLQEFTTLVDVVAAEQVPVPDARLALMFACSHPAIDANARAPLILQTILGLDANAIAAAFLSSSAAMSQRLVRAKTKIRDAGIGLRVPDADELPERLDAVLVAIYAAYAEGWADAAGTSPLHRELVDECIWLGQLVVTLLPDQPEALGLVALMLHTEARRDARRDPHGGYVPLSEQDPRCWSAALIDQAESLLRRAARMARPGRFQLEAAVQSVHAARRHSGATDWRSIARIYDALLTLVDSPVIAINRAVALAHTATPQAGLDALAELAHDRRIADFQPYWAARADLLARAGDHPGAQAAYQRAIGLATDPAVRAFLQKRQRELGSMPRAAISAEPEQGEHERCGQCLDEEDLAARGDAAIDSGDQNAQQKEGLDSESSAPERQPPE